MACGGCSKRRLARQQAREYDVMGGFKHLPERQLKARLETYKKIYCQQCNDRYVCDYAMYVKCKGK